MGFGPGEGGASLGTPSWSLRGLWNAYVQDWADYAKQQFGTIGHPNYAWIIAMAGGGIFLKAQL